MSSDSAPSDSPSSNSSYSSSLSSCTPTATISEPRVTRRVVSLFNKVKRGRICFKCNKFGKTVRCVGECNQYFHFKCAFNDTDTQLVQISNSLEQPLVEHISTSQGNNLEGPSTSRENWENNSQPLASQENNLNCPSTIQIQEDSFTESTHSDDNKKAGSDDEYTNCCRDENYFLCNNCLEGKSQPCFICNNDASPNGDRRLLKCHIEFCGKMYHYICIRNWPIMKSMSYKFIGTHSPGLDVLICPKHFCRKCEHFWCEHKTNTSGKLVTCIKCPAAYHYGNECIPAGSEIISQTEIICPVHFVMTVNLHVNTSWCLGCLSAGQTLFCKSCPMSFHHDCIAKAPPDRNYTCSDCMKRSFPIYEDLVWTIGANYRMWPAKVIHPSNVPKQIRDKAHEKGEFVVKYYTTNEYHWTNRGRIIKFQRTATFINTMFGRMSSNPDLKKAIVQALKACEEADSKKFKKGDKIVRVKGTDTWLQEPPLID